MPLYNLDYSTKDPNIDFGNARHCQILFWDVKKLCEKKSFSDSFHCPCPLFPKPKIVHPKYKFLKPYHIGAKVK